MNSLEKNPNLESLKVCTQNLMAFEMAVQSNNGISSVSYNVDTNMYEYSQNIGSNTIVSLYSTNDILKYHFGDNLNSAIDSGDIYILSQSSGYDIIVYQGQLLGYGATQGIAESTFKEECSSLLKDLAKEYVGQYIEENKGMGVNLAYTFSETGINIYSTIDNTNNESTYDISEFPELFIGFSEFSPSMVLGIASEKVLTNYASLFLSMTGESYLLHIQSNLDGGVGTIDPDWFLKLISGYDEYYEKHGTGGLQYNGEEVAIKFDESAWHDIVKEQVESEIDKAIEESNKSTGYNKIDRLNYLHTIAFINYLKMKFGKDEYVDDVSSAAGIYSENEVIDFFESTTAIETSKIIKKLVAGTKNTATQASKTVYDPIILDLDGDGFNVETKENGTNFDLDKNGFAEKINWTKKDGFLCLDLNNNGSIDNGGEVFGDQTM